LITAFKANQPKPIKFEFQNHNGYLKKLVFVSQDATAIMKNSSISCIEIDGTFKFLRPYILCIPVAIIHNSYVPLGISIGPAEEISLFQDCFHILCRNVQTHIQLIPILSDKGTAIRAFCQRNSLTQYYCITHLLRLIGTNNDLLYLCKKILNSNTEEESENFLKMSEEYPPNLESFDKLNTTLKKIGLNFNKEGQIEKLEDEFQKCCFCYRILKGIPKSTNHIESVHSHLNEIKVRHRNVWGSLYMILNLFRNRYSNIISAIQLNYKNSIEQIERSLHSMTSYELEMEFSIFNPSLSLCNCGQGTHFSQFYNVNIPCRHQLHLGVQFIDPKQLFHIQFDTPQTFTIVDIVLDNVIEFIEPPKKPKKLEAVSDNLLIEINNDLLPQTQLFEFVRHSVKKLLGNRFSSKSNEKIYNAFYYGQYAASILRGLSDKVFRTVLIHYCYLAACRSNSDAFNIVPKKNIELNTNFDDTIQSNQVYDTRNSTPYSSNESLIEYIGGAETADSLYQKGLDYSIGIDVEKDFEKAMKYFQAAYQQGNVKALTLIGGLYRDGNGVDQNFLTAKTYFEVAALHDDPMAFCNLVLLYQSGYGVELNFSVALEYFQRAVDLDHPFAYCHLGLIYKIGIEVSWNYELTKVYVEKSALKGIPKAMCELANLYEEGNRVSKMKAWQITG
jgi:tetratricopeptide (TPR) repeat protein